MDTVTLKILILFGLFIATYGFALLPVVIMRYANATNDVGRRRKIERYISFMSCFAAGVFLGTCLLDLFPEVQETLNSALSVYIPAGGPFSEYPFAESVMVVGFFLVLIVEQVVLSMQEREVNVELVEAPSRVSLSNSPAPVYDSMGSTESEPLLPQIESRPRSESNVSVRSLVSISDKPVIPSNGDGLERSMHQDPSSHSPIRSFIMLAALSLHSVFEGLAVGLQVTVAQVLSIFGALILHKCIIAFSIGLNLVQSRLSLRAIVSSNALFCISSPIGIAIGIIITNEIQSQTAQEMASGLLQGIACGTFLYVTFFEVLPHEFNKPQDRVIKLLFVIFGFIVVNGILFLELYLNHSVQ
ncbi:zinc transporter ZIP1-like [Watersipora subatra]|uniref:zinc transporter ZIP1-like n=1 Tax=Watersipora subatra TaxID=2589382 RepID=UPI00355AD72A